MRHLVRLNKRPSNDGASFTFILRYTDNNGNRRWKTLRHSDAKKAERQRSQLERELRMGYVEPGKIRLSKLLKNYLEQTRTQIEISTADSAAYRMKDFLDAIGNKYADEVKYSDCERFQQYCIDRGLSPATVNTHIKMVKRIFSLAVKRGQIEDNPFVGFSLLKVPRKHIRIFNDNEFDRIIRVSRTQIWKARILLAKTAGLRRGEILNLTIGDIDFVNKKIFVQPKRETSQTWRWVVKDKDRREVPLTDEVAQLLIDIHTELPEGQPYLLLSPSRYNHLLELKAKGLLIDRVRKCPDGNCRRNWRIICKNAGTLDGTFHDLRATCITEWLENGMMPHEVQKLAGHASIDTTMNYYVGIREAMINRAREASSAALSDKKWCKMVQGSEKGKKDGNDDVAAALQTLMNAGVIKIGATGLEPATS